MKLPRCPRKPGSRKNPTGLGRCAGNVSKETDFYRTVLIGYSAFLLALVARFSWRLLASYRLIMSQNTQLHDANTNLEHRVTERTTELRDALDHLKESEAALIQTEKMSSLGR